MRRNAGFSLVELMVAMVIGLIIILGAGQLFLTVFQTNRQVEALSEKQAAVNFAVETLLRDVRRASAVEKLGNSLRLTVPNRGDIDSGCTPNDLVDKEYRVSGLPVSAREGWALEVGLACSGETISNFAQVVAALDAGGESVGFKAEEVDGGVWLITLQLMATGLDGTQDELVFNAVNRTAAVTN
ncbi:PilW family protein [Halomonas mongoliensis]|uniref:Prepilin-type N-terminal cleavage/methylation domain-containing protein n=1 Tax=Halomonas mongoliensis TaxID=321265 RepID=A0ABU1GJP9_9GAMM|nr:prepilin-type N-terminal cleavage/methylation domain-containing protein [Halomonas mongoliensis]MDR5892241.1 prepilin-type N-terminal cleavage/methylation domain-containing protein [Halomonas mongoliensis]